MKGKIWKIGGFLILGVLLLFVLFAWILHKPKPEGMAGPEAEALAQKMLHAINFEAWEKTRFVSWTFVGKNHYIWDRDEHWVEVKWEDYRVLLKIDEMAGKVWKGDDLMGEEESKESLNRAWKMWVNDSFWMNAPAKIMDPGTERYWVKGEKGKEGLLVTYMQGGNTPGDSYLWWLDENGLPTAWQMWVEVIPIGGLTTTWEGWKTLSTGARVSEFHNLWGITLEVTDIRGAYQIEDLTGGENPFSDL